MGGGPAQRLLGEALEAVLPREDDTHRAKVRLAFIGYAARLCRRSPEDRTAMLCSGRAAALMPSRQ